MVRKRGVAVYLGVAIHHDGFSRMRRRCPGRLTPRPALALLAVAAVQVFACSGAAPSGAAGGAAVVSAPARPGARDANLAGVRCKAGSGKPCTCRQRPGDVAETTPPDAEHKRFEVRLGAEGGSATLDSPTLGHLAGGAEETCFYLDVLPGTTSEVTFNARSATAEGGVSPLLDLAEYGPKGPWWYDLLAVRCDGPGHRCNRDAADAWSAEVKTRKRGRIDPCGSAVISHLAWDTSGGTGDRELGIFRDFTVAFTLEVKRFATQFPPGATECVPK